MQDRFYLRYVYNNKIYDVFAVDFFNKTAQLVNLDRAETLFTKVDTDKLIQCTGLRDKNGKLMFEGDIVHKSGSKFNGEKILSEIEWCETSAHFVYSDYIGIGGSHEFRTGTAGKMEVLGNIYENPELIKEKI